MQPALPFTRYWRVAVVLVLLLATAAASAQLSAPTFGTRGGVPQELVETFMGEFRSALARATGLEIRQGELITPGIAGSLEPEFAKLIADLDSARYAISGEVAAVANAGGEPFAVNLIVVDAEHDRSTDLITRPLDPNDPQSAASALAQVIATFTSAAVALSAGDAGLFVSSEPADAQVFVDGISIGHTSRLDVAMLAPGRYRLELRKEGFLPDTRTIELRGGDTTFVHVALTAISGGSIQIISSPAAEVFLDGAHSGTTPLTVPALPGAHRVTLSRGGFEAETFEVLVRNYRVTRVEASLTAVAEPLVFWPESREYLVYIDGVLQPGGYARGLEPGLKTFELVRLGVLSSYLRAVPDSGVYELDLGTGTLEPFQP